MIGLVIALVDYELNFIYPQTVEHLVKTSFNRSVISFTSFLSIISLIFRNYLYTYWKDFKNSIELQLKLIELDQKSRMPDVVDVDDNTKDTSPPEETFNKVSNLKKWGNTLIQPLFIFEFIILAVHPFPGYDAIYTVKSFNFST